MDLKYCYVYKTLRFLLVALVFTGISCSGAKEASNHSIPVEDLPQILKEVSNSDKDSVNQQRNRNVTLNYKNESSDVEIPLNPQGQDFILELKGVEREEGEQQKELADSLAAKDSVISALEEQMEENIKKVLKDFRRAQDLFYREDFKGAMEKVNESLDVQETADALGLKGTIYFMQDEMSSAKYYWNKAVQMDPELPVPDIPELESLIRDIKESEEIEEGEE